MMRSLQVTRMMHWFLSQPVGVQSASAKRKFIISALRRRHDELRDGYHRQKDMLPVLNQKLSKVSLLDQGKPFIASTCVQVAEPPLSAMTHIQTLEMAHSHMIMKINELKTEIACWCTRKLWFHLTTSQNTNTQLGVPEEHILFPWPVYVSSV